MTAAEKKTFSFLSKSLNLLLIDDDINILSFLNKIVEPVFLYSVQNATTAQQAEKILTSPKRIHLCVMDLGIKDINNDEFYLIKKYRDKSAFITFTGSSYPTKGFLSHYYGAKALLEKGPRFKNIQFLKTINYFSLLNIINPRYNNLIKDSLFISTDILFKKSPDNVSQWAKLSSMTDRTLRHIWRNNLGANAKIILLIYQIFNYAFTYFENMIDENKSSNEKKITPSFYKHLETFFHIHKSTIQDFINYGNITSQSTYTL